MRWVLYESAKCAARPAAPDYGSYAAARDRRNAGLATLSVARNDLGEKALQPAA